MSNTLSKTLGLGLPALAEMIRAKGRGKDTVLAHITPREAALLKKRGGAGSINPDTGLLEYGIYDGEYVPDEGDPYIPEGTVYDAPNLDVPELNVGSISQDPNYYNVPGGSEYQPSGNYPSYDLPEPVGLQANQQPLGRPEPTYNYPGGEEDRRLGEEAQALAKAGEQKYPGLNSTQIDRLNEIARNERVDVGQPTLGEEQRLFDAERRYQEQNPSGPPPKPGKDIDLSSLLSQLLKLGLPFGIAAALTKGVAQPAAKKAEDQAQQAKNERNAIAAPYQGIGKGLIAGAQAGNLSASNIQAVKAARAMAAQNISRTGGVGVLQGANSIADLEARLLDNQLIQGIKIANIGDNYAVNAIQAGMQADKDLAASQADFAKQLGVLLAPMVLGYSPTLPSGTPTTGVRQSTGALNNIVDTVLPPKEEA
jgi:hypothetical protein